MATVRQIEIFLQLSETLHFGHAAQQLGITQAALSKEIGKLENSLACRLFDRSDKWNISLTGAGEIYRQQVRELPGKLDLAKNMAQQAARGESGKLTVAVANVIYDYLQLDKYLRAMHEKYPEVKILIRDCQGSPIVCEQIESAQADIGFLAVNNTGGAGENLRKIQLMELPLQFAIPAGHPMAHKKNLQIRDLRNCNFILPPMGQAPWLRKYFEEFFIEQCGNPPQVEQEALGLRATRQLVSAGLGIGLAIRPAADDERENIVYRPIPFSFRRLIVAAWSEKSPPSQILQNFINLLKSMPTTN